MVYFTTVGGRKHESKSLDLFQAFVNFSAQSIIIIFEENWQANRPPNVQPKRKSLQYSHQPHIRIQFRWAVCMLWHRKIKMYKFLPLFSPVIPMFNFATISIYYANTCSLCMQKGSLSSHNTIFIFIFLFLFFLCYTIVFMTAHISQRTLYIKAKKRNQKKIHAFFTWSIDDSEASNCFFCCFFLTT